MRRAALAREKIQPRAFFVILAGFFIVLSPLCHSASHAETMSSALARAYAGNPDLNQERAGVRATDENLPRATSSWRPTAVATGQYGYNYFDLSAIGTATTGLGTNAPVTRTRIRDKAGDGPGIARADRYPKSL